MLVQGITPVLRMPFESVGRRPVLIGTLFVFSGASIGLVFCRRFFVHLILRVVQAGGSAALTSIGEPWSRQTVIVYANLGFRSGGYWRHFNSDRERSSHGDFGCR
jgi:MFS family permease